MVEYFPIPEWYKEREAERDRDSTYADALYENPPTPEQGTLPLPESPGVGIQINREALEYYAVE